MNASLTARSSLVTDTRSDEEIVVRILAGEKELYEVIMRRHNQRLFRIARAYVHDDDEAEEVVQQAYISAYEHLRAFKRQAKFATWLIRILINEAVRRSRQMNRSIPLEPRLSGNGEEGSQFQLHAERGEDPAEKVMNDELRAVLEQTIDALPLKYRAVFVMREIDEMSIAETSESLGISAANVKVRLNRAKEMLKRRISGVYLDAGVYHFDLIRCDRIVARVLQRVKPYGTVGAG